jgi:hypothetical protein
LACEGAARKLRDDLRAQFSCNAFARSSWREAKADLPSLNAGIAAFAFVAESVSELLKFVVNSLLPIERLRQSITSLSRAVGMRLAAAEFSVDLGLEEEHSQGFGITPT